MNLKDLTKEELIQILKLTRKRKTNQVPPKKPKRITEEKPQIKTPQIKTPQNEKPQINEKPQTNEKPQINEKRVKPSYKSDKQRVTIMVGPVGTGKTSYARDLEETSGALRIGTDMYRGARLNAVVREAVKKGRNVVVNGTHPEQSRRRKYTDIAREYGAETSCVQMDADRKTVTKNPYIVKKYAGAKSAQKHAIIGSYFAKFEPLGDECNLKTIIPITPYEDTDENRKKINIERRPRIKGTNILVDPSVHKKSTKTVYMMIGPSGAGKTTYAQRLAATTGAEVVHSNTYKSSRPRINQAIRSALSDGKSVIVNATHPTQARRKQIAKIADMFKANVRCLYKDVDAKTAISRSKLPHDKRSIVVHKFFKDYEKPGSECNVVHTIPNIANTAPNNSNTNTTVHYAPQPMLADKYDPSLHTGPYYASEKLDGIRALAYRGKLYTRSGNLIAAPQWFLDQIPEGTFDGELYTGRKSFNKTSSTVMKKTPVDKEWKEVQYRIFDDHSSKNTYGKTLTALRKKLLPCNEKTPQVCLEKQTLVDDPNEINSMKANIERLGGEGLMLRADSKYQPGVRSEKMLKVKTWIEREARVVGVNNKPDGSIKSFQMRFVGQPYEGETFNLAVQSPKKKAEIRVGHLVTVSFFEYTKNGKPRFPKFKGIRKNM